MKKNLILLAIINLILFACQPNQKQTFEQPEKVVISEQEYKELEETYTAATAIFEFSKDHKDYGSYIASEKIDLEGITDQFNTLKGKWETISSLRPATSKNEFTEFVIQLKTVEALKESAIGLTLKLDKFLGQHIRDLNKKYLTDELISYYKQLRKLGKITDDTRLQELIAWKNELSKPRKKELPQKYPSDIEGIIARYKSCKPCKTFYQNTAGSNRFIDGYSEALLRSEQLPYMLENIQKLKNKRNPAHEEIKGFIYDDELFILLDKLCFIQTKCDYSDCYKFENSVDDVSSHIIDINGYYGTLYFGKSRKERKNLISKKAKENSSQPTSKYKRRN